MFWDCREKCLCKNVNKHPPLSLCTHKVPVNPSRHKHSPVALSHDPPVPHLHLCRQPFPKVPAGQESSQKRPMNPGGHWHAPFTGSQRAPFSHLHCLLQPGPQCWSSQAGRRQDKLLKIRAMLRSQDITTQPRFQLWPFGWCELFWVFFLLFSFFFFDEFSSDHLVDKIHQEKNQTLPHEFTFFKKLIYLFFFSRKVTFPSVKQLHTFTPQRFSLLLTTFSNDSHQSASSNILATLNTESNLIGRAENEIKTYVRLDMIILTCIQCKHDHLMSHLFLFRLFCSSLLREYTFGNPWCHEKHKQKQIWLHLMHLAAKRRKTEEKPERTSAVDKVLTPPHITMDLLHASTSKSSPLALQSCITNK